MFDIIGLLLLAVYQYQTTWVLDSRILRVLVFVSFRIFQLKCICIEIFYNFLLANMKDG